MLEETGELQEGALKRAFKQFDLNGDGEVSWDEAWEVFDLAKHELPSIPCDPHKLHNQLRPDRLEDALKEIFDKSDKNKDGKLNLAEFKDFCGKTMKDAGVSDKCIKKLLSNNDFGLWKGIFDEKDINENKELTWDEVRLKAELLRDRLPSPDGLLLHRDMP